MSALFHEGMCFNCNGMSDPEIEILKECLDREEIVWKGRDSPLIYDNEFYRKERKIWKSIKIKGTDSPGILQLVLSSDPPNCDIQSILYGEEHEIEFEEDLY